MDIDNILRTLSKLVVALLPELNALRYEITWKPDGSPVTEADILLESKITALLEGQIPGIQIVGEETYKTGTAVDREWVAVVDPIDGTENFCSGLREWGVAVSVWQSGAHRGSMLLMPELGERMLTGDIPRVPRSRIVGFSSSFNDEIGRQLGENVEGRIMGCAVYNLFNVIRGSFSRFVNPKGAYSWDLLAGVALAYEAGCEVIVEGKQYDGEFLEPDRRYCVDIRHRYDHHSG